MENRLSTLNTTEYYFAFGGDDFTTGILETVAQVIVSFVVLVMAIILSGSVIIGIVIFALFMSNWYYYDKYKDLEKKLKTNTSQGAKLD